MKIYIILSLIMLVVCELPRGIKRTPKRITRTSDDDNAHLLYHKIVAGIYYANVNQCNGVLYRPDIVLTTATHVQRPKSLLQVKTYPRVVDNNLVSQMFNVSGIKIHNKYYIDKSPKYNIAVVRLDRPRSDEILIELDSTGLSHSVQSANLLGWGYIGDTWGSINSFKNLQLPIVDTKTCSRLNKIKLLPELEFCAGEVPDNFEAYYVSKGSPLVTVSDGKLTLIGINSWTEHYDTAYMPNVFVRIAYFKPWISDILASIPIKK